MLTKGTLAKQSHLRLSKRAFEALKRAGLLHVLYPGAPNDWADLHRRKVKIKGDE